MKSLVTSSARWLWFAALALPLAVGAFGAGCGAGAPTQSSCSPACPSGQSCAAGRCVPASANGCIEVTPSSIIRFQSGANSGWFSATYNGGVAPTLGDGWQSLAMKLRQTSTGTFDLSREPQNTDDCQRCAYVTYAGSGDHFQLDIAVSGTLVLEEYDEDRGVARGVLRDVTFRHLQEVALHSFRGFAPDNHCVHLAEVRFDTRPTTSAPCDRQSDCPNNQLQSCDPASLTCVATQCTTQSPTCASGRACVNQHPLFGVGACYESCVPFTSGACGGGRDCVPIDYVGQRGVCRSPAPNPPAPYAMCTPGHGTTGCGPGHVCATDAIYWHADVCYPQCDFFAANPGCAGRCWLMGHTQSEVETAWLCGYGDCHMGGMCQREWDNAGVRYGQPCPADNQYWACEGSDRRLGVCLPSGGGRPICRQHCRLGARGECPSGLSCQQYVIARGRPEQRAIPGVGVCVP
jgi:hypothetical protein